MAKRPRQSIARSANTPIDFKVDYSTGNGYVSQTKVAELCGVTPHAISQRIRKTRDSLFLNENNQLCEDSVELVIGYYAFEAQRTSKKALASYRMMAVAGIRAFIYSQAGVKVQIAQHDK